jgi:hypothetical protein
MFTFNATQWLWTAFLFPIMTFVFYRALYNEPEVAQKVAEKAAASVN